MNSVNLIGRLTADPDMKSGTSKNGNEYSLASFTIAVNREKGETDFIRVVCFGKQAESVGRFMKKGKRVGINGSLRSSKYTDKDGRTVTAIDVYANNVEFIEPKMSNNRDGGYDDGGFDVSQAFAPYDGDILF